MSNTVVKGKAKNSRVFTPKMSNFVVSSSYEGLVFKKENQDKTIRELKLKYAR